MLATGTTADEELRQVVLAVATVVRADKAASTSCLLWNAEREVWYVTAGEWESQLSFFKTSSIVGDIASRTMAVGQ